jgi:hypothetical protein
MYVKLTNGTPGRYTLRQLRKDNPNTSFPAEMPDSLLADWGVYPYVREEPPTYDPATQTYDELPMVETGGVYSEVYVVRNKTQAELDASVALAAERDAARVQRIKDEFDDQRSVNKVLLKIGFLQENKIRVLEGKTEITLEQFRTWVNNQVE